MSTVNHCLITNSFKDKFKVICTTLKTSAILCCVLFFASCEERQLNTNIIQENTLVSLAPHLTDLVISAGASDHLIGRISYPGDPSPDLPDSTLIGDAFKLDYETVVSLKPDYILSWKGGTPISMINRLKSLNFNVINISIARLSDIPKAIKTIAELTDTTNYSQANIALFNQQLMALKTKTRPSKSVFIQTYHQPLYTISGQHWMSEAAAVCGYQNIFEDLSIESASVSLESVISEDPEAIIIISDDQKNNWNQWPQLKAVKNNNIIILSPDEFSRPSMAVLKGIKKLCTLNET